MKGDLKGFTLAEIMIVLVVIGVLTGILTPLVVNSIPDKKVMKFKKADTTLKNTVRELVNSDQYYVDGDLRIKRMPNGTGQSLDGTHDGDTSYFCNSFVDVISTKSSNCDELEDKTPESYFVTDWYGNETNSAVSSSSVFRNNIDNLCKDLRSYTTCPAIIETSDGIIYRMPGSCDPFGRHTSRTIEGIDQNVVTNECGSSAIQECDVYTVKNFKGFYGRYKVICFDIEGETFGYGLRFDGKIIPGTKAMQWLEKDFQGNDPSEQE